MAALAQAHDQIGFECDTPALDHHLRETVTQDTLQRTARSEIPTVALTVDAKEEGAELQDMRRCQVLAQAMPDNADRA